MASWSFYLGLLGFLAVLLSPALSNGSTLLPFVLYGGLAFAALAIVLGLVGVFSINRASAFAGLLFGVFAVAAYYFYIRSLLGM